MLTRRRNRLAALALGVIAVLVPAVPQVSVRPIWTKADVTRLGPPDIGYTQTAYKRPPFYTGKLPLKYESGAYRYFSTKIILVSDFDGFSNYFVYSTGPTGLA
jgi:hypothetical protein